MRRDLSAPGSCLGGCRVLVATALQDFVDKLCVTSRVHVLGFWLASLAGVHVLLEILTASYVVEAGLW